MRIGEYFKPVLPRDGDQRDACGLTRPHRADTATITETPMTAVFCTISIETRLLSSTNPLSAAIPSRAKAPAILSSALCRPISSRKIRGVRFLLAETDTEPGSCGASHDPGCSREEEDQEAARGGVGRTAGNVRAVRGSRSPTLPSGRHTFAWHRLAAAMPISIK